MSILLLGTFLDTVAAFAIHIIYTLGNIQQITQRGRHDISLYFKGNQVADQGSAITKFTAVLSIPFLLIFIDIFYAF